MICIYCDWAELTENTKSIDIYKKLKKIKSFTFSSVIFPTTAVSICTLPRFVLYLDFFNRYILKSSLRFFGYIATTVFVFGKIYSSNILFLLPILFNINITVTVRRYTFLDNLASQEGANDASVSRQIHNYLGST